MIRFATKGRIMSINYIDVLDNLSTSDLKRVDYKNFFDIFELKINISNDSKYFNHEFLEYLRRINNQLFMYFINELYFCKFYKEIDIDNEYVVLDSFYEMFFREFAKKLSEDIYSIEEKYKTIIKLVNEMDLAISNNDFVKELKNLAKQNSLYNNLKRACDDFRKLKEYKQLINHIRNNEVHSVPVIDERVWKTNFELVYKISNKDLYNCIKILFQELKKIKNIIQEIINEPEKIDKN